MFPHNGHVILFLLVVKETNVYALKKPLLENSIDLKFFMCLPTLKTCIKLCNYVAPTNSMHFISLLLCCLTDLADFAL